MSKKIEFSFIRDKIESEEYTLLSTKKDYKNNRSKLLVICPNNHKTEITWFGWNQGYRCNRCARKSVSSKQKKNFEEIKKSFDSEGYKLLTKEEEYKNNKQKLDCICSKGHKYSVSWADWNSSKARCSICYGKKVSERQKLSYDYIKETFEKRGYTLLSKEYKSCTDYLYYICPKDHKGHGYGCNSCPKVTNNVSKAEIEIFNFVKSLCKDAISSDRLIIHPFELDIVIPSKKIAIEYCGLVWHSEAFGGKDKSYHLDKLDKCNKKGYKLITIFEDEWLYKKKIVKYRLKSVLGLSDTVVYARDCYIKEINNEICSKFLNDNHLQGSGNSIVRLGAFFNNSLISVMTFSKPNISRGGDPNKNSCELNRFCSKKEYKIPGIASKLLTYFERNYNPISIFTYADRRWSEGNLYYKLGFNFTHNSNPNYWYIVGDMRKHRFNFRKSQLKDFNNYDPSISEWEIMKKEGFDRIWDCGNIRFDK